MHNGCYCVDNANSRVLHTRLKSCSFNWMRRCGTRRKSQNEETELILVDSTPSVTQSGCQSFNFLVSLSCTIVTSFHSNCKSWWFWRKLVDWWYTTLNRLAQPECSFFRTTVGSFVDFESLVSFWMKRLHWIGFLWPRKSLKSAEIEIELGHYYQPPCICCCTDLFPYKIYLQLVWGNLKMRFICLIVDQ